MGSTFTATAAVDAFANPSHTVAISYFTTFDLLPFPHFETHFVFGFSGHDLPHDGDPIDAMEDFAFANGEGLYFLTVFAGNAVDYSQSTAPVFIDLRQPTQHGGFAEGDDLGTMAGIDGSSFDDVIRGFSLFSAPEDQGITAIFNNPGQNIFNGGGGNDLLEGRGGADTLNGQSGFDLASYESSPAGVTVRLAGVNGDTQTALASGGDAAGDRLSSIEGLVGSSSVDRLTGNSLDNLLAGGLSSDTLNGMGGTDTVDYSRDHFFDLGDTPDRVEVHLGLNGANGTGDEFQRQRDGTFPRVSTDTLISIENVIGTAGSDIIVGNELDNRLEGRGGSNDLDGGLGDDTLIGGSGIDTANYTSHDALPVRSGEQYVIALGLIGRPGSFTLSQPGSRPGLLQVVESDVLIGIENVTGSNHAETITGNELANTLDGRGGSDTLDGGFGDDILIGNGGTDTASYLSHDGLLADGSPDVISLGNGTSDGSYTRFQALGSIRIAVEADVLRGIENVTGSDSDEAINGNDGINVLDGRGGNDIIDGGLGNDTLIGNGGIDTVSYLSHDAAPLPDGGELDAITLGLGGADGSYFRNQIKLNLFVTLETDVLRGFENATGSSKDEIITGNERDNVLDGRGGADTIDGGRGNDTIDGGLGDDIIIGNTGTDTASTDTVSYVSHDGVTEVVGADIISLGQNGADGSYTRQGLVSTPTPHIGVVETDVLREIENVSGSNRAEAIIGNEQANTLSGRGGDDGIAGRGGDDIVNGGAGDDVYVFIAFPGGSLGTDRFFDESGTNDRVLIDSLSDILPQTGRDGDDLVVVLTTGTFRIVDHFNGHQIESLITQDGQSMVLANGLIGGNGSGIIAGGKGAQTLDGRGGDDFLFGNNGSDRLIGGDGNDRLTGGHGGDTFVFGSAFGHDVVTDFSLADHIEFDGGVFQNFKQVQAASHQVGTDAVITLDADNSITLLGVSLHSLHANDFDFG
jgi:Ca2+-binding RTX toxin-like protein